MARHGRALQLQEPAHEVEDALPPPPSSAERLRAALAHLSALQINLQRNNPRPDFDNAQALAESLQVPSTTLIAQVQRGLRAEIGWGPGWTVERANAVRAIGPALVALNLEQARQQMLNLDMLAAINVALHTQPNLEYLPVVIETINERLVALESGQVAVQAMLRADVLELDRQLHNIRNNLQAELATNASDLLEEIRWLHRRLNISNITWLVFSGIGWLALGCLWWFR